MIKCELCGLRARIYCESDQASLCWDCEEKVHGANFLVAKHTRSLLCHVCQSPTPWKASGPKLTPTVSVCESCVDCNSGKCEKGQKVESQGGNDVEEDEEDEDEVDMFHSSDDEVDDEEDFDEEEDEDEDGENQVVPWSCSSSAPPPPPSASSSSSEEEGLSVSKLMRENADLDSDGEIGCCSLANDEATSSNSFRPLKRSRISEAFQSARGAEDHHRGQEESRSKAIISALRRLQDNVITDDDHASATVLGICKLSRDQSN
ncbi:zinc finger protein CONSTANS-LIKE 9 [Ziziphus jujuba]|uniref:Zinc finger protein CONSTANS-LIKE 9 n=1 Tax=Ziziphus jujuba TaxID=326968 RepID=A0A6P4B574_ZIZJJ|nr:zinc finger protein CONSTANS-LIKE 9 [Ziziphus jujuba]